MANIDHKNNENLRTSYKAGIFGVIMTGFTQDFFAPFLLLAGGSTFHIGLLSSLNNLFSSLAQIPSDDLSRRVRSRKRIVVFFVLLQAAALLALTVFSLINFRGLYAVIAIIVGFTAFGAVTQPCWVSALADMVTPARRGKYFGWRARNLGFTTIMTTFCAGLILYFFNHHANAFWGFACIFALAAVSRFIAFLNIKKMADPPLHFHKESHFNLWDFVSQAKTSNFARFVFFAAGVNFSVNLAAPFFAVFMLEDLHMNYFLYTLINIAAPVSLYTVISRWGHHADVVGNLKVLKIVTPCFALIPLLWILNQHPLYLIGVETLAGVLWAGFNLCSSNFIIDAVTPEKRTRCIAYFHVINGAALALGAFLGGKLLAVLPAINGSRILALFAISSVLRVIVGLTMPRHLEEVRPVERVGSRQLIFSMIGVKPIAGIERKTIQL